MNSFGAEKLGTDNSLAYWIRSFYYKRCLHILAFQTKLLLATPEQLAREKIDEMLEKAGWTIQHYRDLNLAATSAIAVCEFPTDTGPADYILFVNRTPIGVIEAKAEEEAHRLVVHEEQAARYSQSKLRYIGNKLIPFSYLSTGTITDFADARDPKPRYREVFSFHQPTTLWDWYRESKSLRRKLLEDLPQLGDVSGELNEEVVKNTSQQLGLRECQFAAIYKLEQSFREGRSKALIQMATGAGKTFTAITSVYRLLRYTHAKRILFLVDTKNLGIQAEQEFRSFKPEGEQRAFPEIYTLQRLTSSYIATDSKVCISTIQRMYSILQGREIDSSLEEAPLTGTERVQEVTYNCNVPIEMFDFIIIDECHRSIYNLWKQVLDYFDAFQIGLTATPDNRTFGYFNQNVVSEYTHQDAVRDGVNVSYEVYEIETEVTSRGATIRQDGFKKEFRHKLTRQKEWQQIDNDVVYTGREVDRSVVNPSQIRLVAKTFRDKLFTELFPGREHIPKTLIFAKDDSHADDIIRTVREVFDQGNDFCKKITYRTDDDPSSLLNRFRNEYNPRIAVTVDMIATGTDVKALECLIFMRDVRSLNYYEQMKGRGTRTMTFDDLVARTPDAKSDKLGFILIDAVGVEKTRKIISQPLERKRSLSLKELVNGIVVGRTYDEDSMTTLAYRLSNMQHRMSPQQHNDFAEVAGIGLEQLIRSIEQVNDPDLIENALPVDTSIVGEEELQRMREEFIREQGDKAVHALNSPQVRQFLFDLNKTLYQQIDNENLDTLLRSEWAGNAEDNARKVVTDFREWIEEHKDEITALQIFYSQPYRRKELTFSMIRQLLERLKQAAPKLAPYNVWRAFQLLDKVNGDQPKNDLVALVSVLRRLMEVDKPLTSFEQIVNRNFKEWIFAKHAGAGRTQFTEEQMSWLRMMKDHVAASIRLEKDDLELSPFAENGGLGKAWMLFGDDLDNLINEMNEHLAA